MKPEVTKAECHTPVESCGEADEEKPLPGTLATPAEAKKEVLFADPQQAVDQQAHEQEQDARNISAGTLL